MRFLLSSLCVLLVGCVSYPKKIGFEPAKAVQKEVINPYFSNKAKDYVYKARIDALGKAFGGILIIKKLDGTQHRIVFTTELGNTLFDFSIAGETFIVNRILAEMDNKILINILKKDFITLVREVSVVDAKYFKNSENMLGTKVLNKKHYYMFGDGVLQKIIRMGSGKEKVLFLFSGISDNIAAHIEVLHQNIPLNIRLDAF